VVKDFSNYFFFRRAAGDPIYTEASVHMLPGYPEENGTDLLIAFYVVNPPSNASDARPVIPVLTLIQIAENSRPQFKV